MANINIEELYSSFVKVVAAESKMLEHVETTNVNNSSFIGLYGITKENYTANFELAEALKRILQDPFIAELLNHIESTGMHMGSIISDVCSTDSKYLAAYWSEQGGRGPGFLVLDYCYQPKLPDSFSHLACVILLSIKRTAEGYTLTPCDEQNVLLTVEYLLKRSG